MNAAMIDPTAGDLEKDDNKLPRSSASQNDVSQGVSTYVRPKGPKIFGISLPAYRSPIAQTLIIALVHSLVVGMFNVLSALGGGGQVNPETSNNANTILYSLFAVFSLFSGSVCNFLGTRITLAAGGIGYSLLTASYWSYNYNMNKGFVYFGGAMCGIAAAFLWTAEGAMIMSLPLEKDKGRYISLFYGISFFITVIGAIIPTVENWSVTTAGSANDQTYIALFVLMVMGSVVACFVAKPETITRNDGSRVLIPRQTTFIQELKNVGLAIKREPWIILFFPYSFAGLWYIPYQSNDYNAYFFDLRTRGFASLWYDFGQFFMAVCIGFLLDLKYFSRRTRAFLGWTFLFVLANAVFIAGVFPMKKSHRGFPPEELLDVTNPRAGGYIALFVFYGCVDGAWQTFAWWIIGTLSNDPLVLSIYSAFYKVFGATGAAIIFSLDNKGTSYQAMFGSYWGLISGSMLLVLIIIVKRVSNSTDAVEEMVVSNTQLEKMEQKEV